VKFLSQLKGIEGKWLAAFISCLLMMVQGDITAVDVPHWIKAAKTASSASVIFAVMVFIPRVKDFANERLGGALSFGGGVFVSDLWIHPTHFGIPTAEALTTALLSAVLAYIAHDYLVKQ
jgi:hypothetical protein